jgi:hypothetical protein
VNGIPTIQAYVTLLADLERGRNLAHNTYRPHIVVGPVSRPVADRTGIHPSERYLGVVFIGRDFQLKPGEAAEVTMALMYYPDALYEDVVPGASFTIREGTSVVGYGTVLSRTQPHSQSGGRASEVAEE